MNIKTELKNWMMSSITGWKISLIFILPEYQGQGIAQKAIQLCEELHGNGNWELETILQEPRNCQRLTLTFYEKRVEVGRI